jgi:hypothetical protein
VSENLSVTDKATYSEETIERLAMDFPAIGSINVLDAVMGQPYVVTLKATALQGKRQ